MLCFHYILNINVFNRHIILSASKLISYYRIVLHFRKYAANKMWDFEIKWSVILKMHEACHNLNHKFDMPQILSDRKVLIRKLQRVNYHFYYFWSMKQIFCIANVLSRCRWNSLSTLQRKWFWFSTTFSTRPKITEISLFWN